MRDTFMAFEYFSFILLTYVSQKYDSGGGTVISSGSTTKRDESCNKYNTIAVIAIKIFTAMSLFINLFFSSL